MVEIFNSLLDPVFSPLLKLEPIFAIIIIAFLISLMITLAYKKFTNQSLMKDLKNEIKELQKEMKDLKNDPEKMMEVQKKAMDTNSKYMMHSLRPTLFTFIPIIIIFGWLNAHMAFFPLVDGQDFTTTITFEESIDGNITIMLPDGVKLVKGSLKETIAGGKTEWVLNAPAGEYVLNYEFQGKEFDQKLIISDSITNRKYAQPVLTSRENSMFDELGIIQVALSNEKIHPIKRIPVLSTIIEAIPLIGNWIVGWGWLGTYILFSIIFSMTIRKLMKVY